VFILKNNSSAAADFTVPDLVEKDKTKEEYNNRFKKGELLPGATRKTGFIKTVNFKTYQTEPKNAKEKKDDNDSQNNAGKTEARANTSKKRM